MSCTHDKIVEVARLWLGTPYHHQQHVKGVGTDCLGLIVGIYKELYGEVPTVPLNYSNNWMESTGKELMLQYANEYLTKIPMGSIRPGVVALFRMHTYGLAKHAGIITDWSADSKSMIHAQEGLGVVEVYLNRWWENRIISIYEFP